MAKSTRNWSSTSWLYPCLSNFDSSNRTNEYQFQSSSHRMSRTTTEFTSGRDSAFSPLPLARSCLVGPRVSKDLLSFFFWSNWRGVFSICTAWDNLAGVVSRSVVFVKAAHWHLTWHELDFPLACLGHLAHLKPHLRLWHRHRQILNYYLTGKLLGLDLLTAGKLSVQS